MRLAGKLRVPLWRVPMFLSKLAAFEKPIEISSPRDLADAVRVLQRFSVPSIFRSRDSMFVGRADIAGGCLWFRPKSQLTFSARTLCFRLTPTPSGCLLQGKLSAVLPLRLYAALILGVSIITGLLIATSALRHGASMWLAARYLLQQLVGGAVIIYAFCGFAVWVGSRCERLGLAVLRQLLQSDVAASVVADLLDSRQ